MIRPSAKRLCHPIGLAIGLASGLCACSSSPNGSGMVSGSILGSPLPVSTSISYSEKSSSTGSTTVVLGSWDNGCALGMYTTPKNSQALIFGFAQGSAGATQPVTAPGTFTVVSTPQADGVTVTFVGNDSACAVTSADTGISGTVTLTSVSGTEIDGSFDVVLKTSGPISGTFSAPDCPADDAEGPASSGGPPPACQ